MKKTFSLAFIWILTNVLAYGQMPVPLTKLTKGCFRDSTLTYDGKGNLSAKRLFLHNELGHLQREVLYLWRSGNWQEDKVSNYKYDRLGNMIEILVEKSSLSVCTQSERSVFGYDDLNRLITNAYYKGYGNYWEAEEDVSYSYDATGNIKETLRIFHYDNSNKYKTLHTYDSVGHEIYSLSMKLIGNDWRKIGQKTFYYDNDGRNTAEVTQTLDDSDFKYASKFHYVYDTKGNQIEKIELTWTMGAWKNLSRTMTSYDSHGNAHKVIHSYWNSDKWIVRSDVHRHYNCRSLGKGENMRLELWPNPSLGELNISVYGIEQPLWVTVIAMNGQRVLQQSFTSKLNVETLEAGSYIIEVMTGSTIHRAQFVKK